MSSIALPPVTSRQRVAGRILTGLAALFLLMDGVMKLVKPQVVVDATTQLGFPEGSIVGLGITLIVATALYLLPRTAVLGAVLLTAYLGGAVAAHVRIGSPVFSHVLFPVYIAAMAWAGVYLRNPRLRIALGWRPAEA